jgi:hypothetical protein
MVSGMEEIREDSPGVRIPRKRERDKPEVRRTSARMRTSISLLGRTVSSSSRNRDSNVGRGRTFAWQEKTWSESSGD